jgi:hypothetical protein
MNLYVTAFDWPICHSVKIHSSFFPLFYMEYVRIRATSYFLSLGCYHPQSQQRYTLDTQLYPCKCSGKPLWPS